jgi:primosomal protein N' (replication factor Y)
MADTALALPDFRAAERTFQLLAQVGGRAGRGKDAGRVLVQTYNPEADPIQCVLAHDFERFAQGELERRRALFYPPFARLVAIRVEGENATLAQEVAERLGDAMAEGLPKAPGVRLLGPAPAPLAKLKGKTRYQLLLKGPSHAALAGPLSLAERLLPDLPSSVKVALDVDPGAML